MRKIIELNEGWKFSLTEKEIPSILPAQWETVDLPHTWNAVDGHDGNGSFLRTTAIYAKCFTAPKQPLKGGRVYIEIPAAGQQASVYVNGEKVIYHEGGYSAFRADITSCLNESGENLLVVECSNEAKSNIYPQSADFTFYGGLYRGVNLISVPETHFDLDTWGGPGIKVTSVPENGGARFSIETTVTNPEDNFTVLYSIADGDGHEVAAASRPSCRTEVELFVPDVTLWDIDTPYLYTVTARLQRRNETYDELCVRNGVRTFSCDPSLGFILNGVPTPLRGVSRHQDMLYKGNALSKEDHYNDARIIKELGANTIRLAHYQHSQDFYDACDELGFIVWAEIPFISVMSKDPAAHDNCVSQLTELITQNYNHSSICFWSISNEILIGGISQQLVDNHKDLNALAKKLDPTRLTTIAHVSMTPVDSPLHGITDVESYNHYFGWYGGKYTENGPWFDQFHEAHPEICLGLSEYGCEGIITYHGPNPQCKDYSEEYQAEYHEHLAQVLDERPWMWSSHVWNMFDFGCAARDEGGVAGRNNKGLVTMDRRTKKDSFYVYQAYWSKKPMVHIVGRRYAERAGETTVVKVYSNQPSVALYLNGELAAVQSGYRVFRFELALKDGFNTLLAIAGDVKDSITLEKVDQEPDIYYLPEAKERSEGIANWFQLSGSLDLTSPMEFPEGFYSIKDTFHELYNNEEAFAIATEAAYLATSFKMQDGKGMFEGLKNFTVEQMLTSMSTGIQEGFLESINAKLIKIKK